jgi:hypothetical protein
MNIPHLPIEEELYDGLIRYKTSAATMIGFAVSVVTNHVDYEDQTILFLFMTKKGRFFTQHQRMHREIHWFSKGSWECYDNKIDPIDRLEAFRLLRDCCSSRSVDIESLFPDAEDA